MSNVAVLTNHSRDRSEHALNPVAQLHDTPLSQISAQNPGSPMGLLSSDSSISRRDETHQPNTLDNLDLLASVTQKIDVPVSPNSVSSERIQRIKQLPAKPEQKTERGRRRKSSSAQLTARGPLTTRCACAYMCACLCMRVCPCMRVCSCMYVCPSVHVCPCMYVCPCVIRAVQTYACMFNYRSTR